MPACVGDNPCGFTCLNGYTASPPSNPTTCVCPAPNVVCNGNCVASGACPSSQATRKRRLLGSGSCTEKGPGWAACGVFGGGTRAWECVNTAHDLESCECFWCMYHPLFSHFHFRWWMRAPPDAFLADRRGLHCAPWYRGRLLSIWRVCCPALHARICSVA